MKTAAAMRVALRPNGWRVQRIRSSPTAPLTRHPLGRGRAKVLIVLLALAFSVDGCNSTEVVYSPVGPHQYHAVVTAWHNHGLFHLGSCGFSQAGETYRVELLTQHDGVYTKPDLSLSIDN
jgi:hypothetical protein